MSPPRARVGGSGTATWDKALRGLSTLNARAAVSQYHLELEVRGFSAASVWLSPCWLHSCTAPEWLENPRDQPFRLAEPPPAWWPSPALRKRYSRSSKAQTAKARPRPRRGPFKPRARFPRPHPTCDGTATTSSPHAPPPCRAPQLLLLPLLLRPISVPNLFSPGGAAGRFRRSWLPRRHSCSGGFVICPRAASAVAETRRAFSARPLDNPCVSAPPRPTTPCGSVAVVVRRRERAVSGAASTESRTALFW